ncbi:MAG: hypothetical protein IPP85_18915 [Propionivibrio sp.]|nr:hypothetical protein [Propionivibrio sp.]
MKLMQAQVDQAALGVTSAQLELQTPGGRLSARVTWMAVKRCFVSALDSAQGAFHRHAAGVGVALAKSARGAGGHDHA